MDAKRIEISLSQDKIDRINNSHQTELKKVLERGSRKEFRPE